MKAPLKVAGALVAALFLVASTRALANNRVEKPIFAGQHILVGTLVVENNSTTLTVTYDLTRPPAGYTGWVPGWTMQATHLYVGKSAPRSSAPGRFPFKHEGLANVSVDTYVIPLSRFFGFQCGGGSKKLYIAAHADTCEQGECVPDFAAMAAALPTGVTDMNVQWNYVQSYFNIVNGGGSFLGWCFDELGPIGVVDTYGTAYHLSVLADGSPNPEALALLGPQIGGMAGSPINYLNYLINQPYVIDCGNGGPYSFVDIQVAIWVMTNGAPVDAFGANAANVTAILNDVIANGAAFVPGCGDLVLVMVDPQTPIPAGAYPHNQHIGYAVPVAETTGTGDCETAWAKGTVKFCTGWGSYFAYYVK